MLISITLNGEKRQFDVAPQETLFHLLRREGLRGVKFGSEDGSDGYSTVLVNGRPYSSVVLLAAQADGAKIVTVEGLSKSHQSGWHRQSAYHPLQRAFIETGAIQSGYDTPALMLAGLALLTRTANPTEAEIRDAISGIVSRETGYVKPIAAILRAAAYLRGDTPPPVGGEAGADLFTMPDTLLPSGGEAVPGSSPADETGPFESGSTASGGVQTRVKAQPTVFVTAESQKFAVVGQPLPKVDAPKLAQGHAAFVADFERPGMLYGKILHSPHAHARIKDINTHDAEALPGVRAVLTYKNVPRVIYSTAGQSYPIPGPLDYASFDNKVRYVGDRVAAVAADTPEIAEEALSLIRVDYEVLPPVLDLDAAMAEGSPIIHDEEDYVPFGESDPTQNLVAKVKIDVGDVDAACEQAAHVFETTVDTQRMKHVPLEPWVTLTYWDEDDRLVILTSTQVPFHVRRILAPVLGLTEGRIRVIKPRIGAAFGNKQEIYEDIPAHLTIATGRPVLLELTREEQFIYTTTRHPMRVKFRIGVDDDGTMVAQDMRALSDTGAYGGHGLTVLGNTGHKTLPIYDTPNVRFWGETYYTTLPRAGAYRGYGVTQGVVATETLITQAARELGWDPLEFRLKNIISPHTENIMSKTWSEGREARGEIIETNALREAALQGAAAVGWTRKYGDAQWHVVPGKPHLRRGIGVAFLMQGSGIPNLDMAAASIKMNDDGSFNLMMGATDLGTGSDTVLGQIAAEVLGCSLDDLIIRSSDTDVTPFDKGAYASSTTYISGGAVARTAEDVARQIKAVAADMAGGEAGDFALKQGRAWRDDGLSLSFREIALHALHTQNQHQIMGHASFVSPVSPPPFAAQFAEVTVDTETGQTTVDNLLIAVDSGQIINPLTAAGQAEGGMHQALGYALTEELIYDAQGRTVNPRFDDYRVFRADESPPMQTLFIETFEPSHPVGAKSVAEIVVNGVTPAVLNAIHDATGIMLKRTPVTPERLWKAHQAQAPPKITT